MKVFTENRTEKGFVENPHIQQEHGRRVRPIPPHERKAMLRIEFGDNDHFILNKVFGDDDTAHAAARIIQDAPPEIQILAVQLLKTIERGVR